MLYNRFSRHARFDKFHLVRGLKTSTRVRRARADEFEEVKIPVPWGHVAGKWWGDRNGVPALAVHGWQDNASTFDRLIPLLNVPSVLAIDLPGHGLSSHLPKGKTYDFQEHVVLLHRIVKTFNWTSMPMLAHSLGGGLAYAYTSIFPDRVKWLVTIENGISLLTLHRYNLAGSFSSSLDSFLKVEKQKNEVNSPAYKLSELIKMTVVGSLGSISPESAMILLRRGTELAEDPKADKDDKRHSSNVTDLQHFVSSAIESLESLPEEKQEEARNFYAKVMEDMEKVKANLKKVTLTESEDKYYRFTRDPSLKAQAFLSPCVEFVVEASKHIKCPVLSLRATGGFLQGTSKLLDEQMRTILKESSPLVEHHEVPGTHHTHLNTPENVAPVINSFLGKVDAVRQQ